jgi:hypothetical protein
MPREGAEKQKVVEGVRDEAQEVIEKLAQKTAVMKNEISTGTINANNEMKSLEAETQEIQESINSELLTFNNAVTGFKQGTSKIRRGLVQGATDFVSSVYETKESIEEWTMIVLVIAVCGLSIWQIIALINTNSFSFDPALFSILVLTIAVAASVNLTLRYTHRKFATFEDKIVNSTKQVMDDTFEAVVQPLEFRTDTRGLKSKIISAASDFNRTITAVAHFVPEYSNYNDLKSKFHQLEIFKQSLRNALTNFGIPLDSVSENILKKDFPPEKEPNEWLDSIAEKLSPTLGVPVEIIELAYYEYTDSSEGKNNQWNKILVKQELISRIVRILCRESLVEVSYLNIDEAAKSPAVQLIISQMPFFSLEEFRKTYYSFYRDLANDKRKLLRALSDFDIDLEDSDKSKVITFVPKEERALWVDELINWTASMINIPSEIVGLIYFEKSGKDDRIDQLWKNVRTNSLDRFVLLLRKQQLSIPTNYETNDSIIKYLKKTILSDTDAYSHARITEKIRRNIANIDRRKKILLQAVEHYTCSLSEQERYEFECFLPIEGNEYEALIQEIAERIGTTVEIVRLFYFAYVQKTLEEKTIFKEIKDSTDPNLLMELSELLINKNKVQLPIGEKNTGAKEVFIILRTMERLDIIGTQLLLNKYIALRNYLSQLSEFAIVEQLIEDNGDEPLFDFTDLIAITKLDSVNTDILLHIDSLLLYLLKNKNKESLSYSKYTEISAATIALFLWRIRDSNRKGACEKAADFELSAKILYQYQILNENTIGKQPISLHEVIDGVLNDKFTGYECLTEFTLNLKHGLLVCGREELFTESIRQIKQKISVNIKEYEDALTELQTDVITVFKTQLDSDVTTLFLNSNLISAYLITTNKRSPVIKGIIDKTLDNCCKELAKNDSAYENFLLLESKSKSVGGFHTRTGLVPLGMSFKQFSENFERLFGKAKEEYKKAHPSLSSKNYSVNLLRILPSEIAFKAILDASSVKTPTLMETISSLIVDKLDLIDTFEFLTSLSGTEPKVELQSVVKTAIDQHTSLYSIINADISDIGISSKITEPMKSGAIDKKLMAKYNCRSLSALAIAVYKLKVIAPDENKNEKLFYDNLIEAINESKSNLDSTQLSSISKIMYKKLEKYGRILSL